MIDDGGVGRARRHILSRSVTYSLTLKLIISPLK